MTHCTIASTLRCLARAIGGVAILTAALSAPLANASTAPSAFLSIKPYKTTFVEFTVSHSRVVGALTTATVTNRNPNAYLASRTTSFTGTDSGGQLTLYFHGDGSSPEFGSVSGHLLSLQVRKSNGAISTVTFNRTSVSAYSEYIRQWQAKINNANAAARAAAAKAAAAAAHKQRLVDRINQTVATIHSDVSAMESPSQDGGLLGSSLSHDEGTLAGDVGYVTTDFGDVQTDMGYVATDLADPARRSELCSDVSLAYGDAATAAKDARGIRSDAQASDAEVNNGSVGQDILVVQHAMARLAPDYVAYSEARHALPSYHPMTAVPPLSVVLATGKSIIRGAVRQVNSYINQANAIVARAYALPNAAQKANKCGPVKTIPVLGQVTAAFLTS